MSTLSQFIIPLMFLTASLSLVLWVGLELSILRPENSENPFGSPDSSRAKRTMKVHSSPLEWFLPRATLSLVASLICGEALFFLATVGLF